MRIAGFTMAFNEAIFLPIWYSYYGQSIGFENLYVLDHGSTDGSTSFFHADRRIKIERTEFDEVERGKIVADFQAKLLSAYDVVIFTDTDEILVPRVGAAANLGDFIRRTPGKVIRAAGVNLIQVNDEDAPIDLSRPLLAQRQLVQVARMYSKTLITRVPVRWSAGFHSCSVAVEVDPDIVLFHLKNMDGASALQNQAKLEGIQFSARNMAARYGRHFLQKPADYVAKAFTHTREIVNGQAVSVKDIDTANIVDFRTLDAYFRYSSTYHDRIGGATLAGLTPQILRPPALGSVKVGPALVWTGRRVMSIGATLDTECDLPMLRDNPRNHITANSPGLVGHRVLLSADVRPAPGCTAILDVSQGEFALCHLLPDRRRLACLRAETATLQPAEDGYTRLTVTWRSAQDCATITAIPIRGGASAEPEAAQWQVRNLRVDIKDELRVEPEAQLVYVDIGARGGLPPHIARFGNLIHPVLVDADEAEANAVVSREKTWFAEVTAVPFGLADHDETRTLYVTRAAPCSSLLRPTTAVLSRYPRGSAFKTIREVSVPCRRYDSLFDERAAPMPDYIKIDVQGFEYQVLKGFGRLLKNVIGIELECHVYALYEGQKLLGDLVAFLDDLDFSLRALQPQNARAVFNGEVCEFNAWFLKRDHAMPTSPGIEQKLELCRTFTPRS